MSDTPAATPPPLIATAYQTLASNVLEQTFDARRTEALQGAHDLDRPKVFTDVLAVETMKAYQAQNSSFEPLRATTSESTLPDGTTAYSVALRDEHGSGVSFSVDSKLDVRVTSTQGSEHGTSVDLPAQNFRWNDRAGIKEAYLEHSVGTGGPGGTAYVPYSNPSLAGGDDLEGGLKLIVDGANSAFHAGKPSRPGAIMASANDVSHEGVRTVTATNQFGTITNGYSQAGPIAYNGFSIVEQNAGPGKSVFYDKSDLLRNAHDRPALERVLEQRGSVDLSMSGDRVHGRLEHTREEPTKAAAQAAVENLRATGAHAPNVSKIERWNGQSQSGTFIDLGDGVVAQHVGRGVYRHMDVSEHFGGVTPPIGQNVSLDRTGQIQQTEHERTHVQSLGR